MHTGQTSGAAVPTTICPQFRHSQTLTSLFWKYAGTQTEKNLEAAFAGESQARNKYTYFASKAKKEGFEQIRRTANAPVCRALRHISAESA